MISLFHTTRFTIVCLGVCLLLSSCKYEELAKADYPQQILYMPASKSAQTAPNTGVFSITSISTTGAYKFTIKLDEKKLIIPLSVYRGGVSVEGNVPVTIVAKADTVSQLISAGILAATMALPADKFTLPESVTIAAGGNVALFDLSIDLDYLKAQAASGQKLAVAVGISSLQTPVNPAFSTTLISLDPAILIPVPNFTTKADATTPSKIGFTNTSKHAIGYSWNFGDGSAAVTDMAPTYTYAAAGTYTVTLTATGVTGNADAVTKTMEVIIP